MRMRSDQLQVVHCQGDQVRKVGWDRIKSCKLQVASDFGQTVEQNQVRSADWSGLYHIYPVMSRIFMYDTYPSL